MSIYAELKRRNVIRVAIAYGVASWVLLQIVDVVTPILDLPAWAPKLIFVILAIGMVAVLVFAWVFELTPEGLKKDSDVDRSQSIQNKTGRKLNFVIVAFLALAVVLLLADRQLNKAPADAPAAIADAAATPDANINSIAVLPFVNMSSDAEQEYFSDGITEEILNSLASVKDFKVAGRTSSFAFKGQNLDLRKVGDALGVSHILEGSVRKAGAEVRITAQLIQVDDGFHLWSETYDRELTDVFEIQDEIANEILQQLKSHLLTDDIAIAEVQQTSPEAYDLYLKAKQRIYSRIGTEIEGAREELDQAIQLDPAYAPAYAQRAVATMLLSEAQYGDIPDDEANRRGKRFVDRALELDDSLAEAWAALGLYLSNQPGRQDDAIDPLMKALSINPNLIDASNWLQIALRGVGDFKGSLEVLVDLAERDPMYRPAFANALQGFNQFGEPEKAEALLGKIEAIDPENPDLLSARAINFIYSGRVGDGLKAIEERAKHGNMNGVDMIYLSIGLQSTLQFERAVEEGSVYFRPDALYALGRTEEAFDLAYDFAKSGYPNTLFNLLNRAGRSQDLVNYLEERWPGISDFADENRGDELGYGIMREVALAYSRVGNAERFSEAMGFIERHAQKLQEQGVDNTPFLVDQAIYFALLDDRDQTFDRLQRAAERGWAPDGRLAERAPALAVLADDPRFAEVETTLLSTTNRDRAIVGLPPVDENYEAMAALSPTSL
ncbi:MAG TPA: hypothetical protein PKK10_04785 [Woeseiaceae bacterium]|nr:hypothetical protein [Woeseiaceae bacterium]